MPHSAKLNRIAVADFRALGGIDSSASVRRPAQGGSPPQLRVHCVGAYLLAYLGYILSGNASRFVQTRWTSEALSFGEAAFYVVSAVFLLINYKVLWRIIVDLYPVTMLVAGSFAYGVFIHGVDVVAFLYAARLVIQLIAGSAAGYAVYSRFGNHVEEAVKWHLKVYLAVITLAVLLFAAFPNSAVLWATLKNYNIQFEGDPHQMRLVSLYFDPNFFSAILGLPLVMALALSKTTGRFLHVVFVMIVVAAILATVSRSGIVAAVMVGMYSGARRLPRRCSARMILVVLMVAILGGVSLFAFAEHFQRILRRFNRMDQDHSAMVRKESFEFGTSLLEKRPLFGCGYNYLVGICKRERGRPGLDSSFQSVLVSLGYIPTITLCGFCAFKIRRWFVRLRRNYGPQSLERALVKGLVFYVIVCAGFTAHFNNLLFYQFWLIPVVLAFTYVQLVLQHVPLRVDRLPVMR